MTSSEALGVLPDRCSDSRQPRVLIVEDDPIQGRGLLRLLDACAIEAHVVTGVGAGLAAVASQPTYDVIISDQGLPDMPGGELARRLRSPLLVSYSGRSDWPSWFDIGLTKPALHGLLKLLRAPRLDVSITQMDVGDFFGICKQEELRCRGSSPVHVLRMLATALAER